MIMSSVTQGEGPVYDKLVNITPITMSYDTYNYSHWGLQTNL